MRSGRTATVALVFSLLAAAVGVSAAGAAEPPDGLLGGTPHVVRLRPRLADLPDAPRRIPRAEAARPLRRLPRATRTRCRSAPALDPPGRRRRAFMCGPPPTRRFRSPVPRARTHLRRRDALGQSRSPQRPLRGRPASDAPRGGSHPAHTLELAGIPNFLDLDGEVIGSAALEDAQATTHVRRSW